MGRVGRGEYGRARRDTLPGQAMVHVGGRQQAQAGVMVLGVVPLYQGKKTWARALSLANPPAQRYVVPH
jgi:hypothetical protein